MPSYHIAACVRVAWRAGHWQRYGAHSNWICQNSPPVNVEPLLHKAVAHDLQLSKHASMALFVILLLLFLLLMLLMVMMTLMMLMTMMTAIFLLILFTFIVLAGSCDTETNSIHTHCTFKGVIKYDGDDFIMA